MLILHFVRVPFFIVAHTLLAHLFDISIYHFPFFRILITNDLNILMNIGMILLSSNVT